MNRHILLVTSAVVIAGLWYFCRHKPSTYVEAEPQSAESSAQNRETATASKPLDTAASEKEENNTTHVSDASQGDSGIDSRAGSTHNSKEVKAIFPDGHTVSLADIQKVIFELPAQAGRAPFETLFEAVLTRLVDDHLLGQAAKNKGLDVDEDVKIKIKEARAALIQRTELERRTAALITEDQKKRKYDEVMSQVNKNEQEVAFRAIPLKAQEDAQSLLKRLQSGEIQFNDIFQKSNGLRGGGERGYARAKETNADIWKTIAKTMKGRLASETPMAEGAYWVIYVDDKRDIVLPRLEEVESEIVQALMPEHFVSVIKALRNEMPAKRFDLRGNELPPEKDESKPKPESESVVIDLKKEDTKKVVARFESGETISVQDVVNMHKMSLVASKNQPLTESNFMLLLDRILDLRRLSKAAEASKLSEREDIKKQLHEIYYSVLHKSYLDIVIEDYLKAHPTEMKERYEAIRQLWPKGEMEVRLRVILMDQNQEDVAQKVLKDLRANKIKWDDAVNQYSVDDAIKEHSGDVGYIKGRSLPEDLAPIVLKAAKATLLPEVVRLVGKVAIIRVEDKRPVTPPSFQDVETNIRREIEVEVSTEHLSRLRQDSGVKAFDISGKPLDLEVVSKRLRKQIAQALNTQQGARQG